MGLKQQIVCSGAQILKTTGMTGILARRYGGRGVILTFHDISENRAVINRAGTVTLNFLERTLKAIYEADLQPLRLQDVPQYLQKDRKRRFVALTFDDGYKNTLALAAPLLERYQIPATVFVTSGAFTGNLNYAWGALEYYLARHDEIKIGDYGARTKTLRQKQKAYREIMGMFLADFSRWEEEFTNFINRHAIDVPALVRERFLDGEGIKALAAFNMIDIGGHTVSHPALARLDEQTAFQEILNNKRDLEALTGREVKSLAYPYGNAGSCTAREFTLAQRAGYGCAVTANAGAVFEDHKNYPHALPRFGVSGLYESRAMLDLYFTGAWQALRQLLPPRSSS